MCAPQTPQSPLNTTLDTYFTHIETEHDNWMAHLYKKIIYLFLQKHYIEIKFLFRKRINRMIINKKFDDGITLLHLAIFLQDLTIVTILINAGANPRILDSSGKPSTHYILLNANYTTNAKMLHKMKEHLNLIDTDGNTLLHLATGMGATHIANALIRLGADTTIRNRKGKLACDYMVK